MRLRSCVGLSAIALFSLASACPNVVPDFRSFSTDGQVRNAKSFIEKPTVLVFLKRGCPCNVKAMPWLNSLSASFGDKWQVIGVVNTDLLEAEKEAQETGARIPLIADSQGVLRQGFQAQNSLDFSIVATKREARWPKLWQGMSQKNMTEALDIIVRHGHASPGFTLEQFPVDSLVGCDF